MKNESCKIYTLALQEYPNSFLLNYSFGRFLSQNKNEEALVYYQKCIDLYDESTENKEFRKEYENALEKISRKKL
jgi:hypothetical protein